MRLSSPAQSTHWAASWRPLELAAMIAGFIVFWPIGLAVLFWKYKMGGMNGWSCRRAERRGWREGGSPTPFGGDFGWGSRQPPSSGNSAFDAYREAEYARLEAEYRRLSAEQEEFASFLDELRRAKDKVEFEQYLAARAARQSTGSGQPPTA